MQEHPSISSLSGLGPKSQAMLAKAGITSSEQLRALGSVAAFVMVKRAGCGPSLNLLWGLESALSGMHWREIAHQHRTSLLFAVEEHERRTEEMKTRASEGDAQ
jgi:TfoX-like protein